MRSLLPLLACVASILPATAHAQTPYRVTHAATQQQFKPWIDGLVKDNYRPVSLHAYNDGGIAKFASVALENQGNVQWRVRYNLDHAGFQKAFEELVRDDYRLVQFAGYLDAGQPREAGLFIKGDGNDRAWQSRSGLTRDGFRKTLDEQSAAGKRPTQALGYPTGQGGYLLAAIFVEDNKTVWTSTVEMTDAQYQQRVTDSAAQGYRTTSLSVYPTPEGPRFGLVMIKDGAAWKSKHGLTAQSYQTLFDECRREGFRPVSVAGYETSEGLRYAAVWVKDVPQGIAVDAPAPKPAVAVDASALKGKRVVVIHDKAPLSADGKNLGVAAECSFFTVDSVNGNWLWIKSQKAYLKSSDVIPFEEAIGYYTRQMETDRSGTPYWHRAEIWRLKGELDLALNDMTEAIRLNPRPNYYSARGVMRHNKHEYDQAIADFGEAIRLDPKNGTPYHNRARVFRDLKDYDRALADFDMAIRLKGPSETTRVMSDTDLAGADSSQMINSLSLAYFTRGYTWLAKGDFEKALADYDEAIRRDARHEKPRLFRRELLAKMQAWDKLAADCQEALTRDAKDANALNALARLRATCPDETFRNGQEAVELAQKASDLRQGKDAGSLDTLAAAYAEAGDFDQAIATQQKAISQAKGNVIGEFEARLKLYRDRQPFRPAAAPK